MGKIVGYARASSIDQHLEAQVAKLEAAGAEIIFQEKQSGRDVKGREQLELAMQFVRDGDTLLVTRIDRFARNMLDLKKICQILEEKGVALRAVDQPFDTGSTMGRMMRDMLGVFAEFEVNMIAERRRDGQRRILDDPELRKLKYPGRSITYDKEKIKTLLLDKDMTVSQIAKQTGFSRTHIYKIATKEGIDVKGRSNINKSKKEYDMDLIKTLLRKKDATIAQIAETIGVSRSVLYKIIDKEGIGHIRSSPKGFESAKKDKRERSV